MHSLQSLAQPQPTGETPFPKLCDRVISPMVHSISANLGLQFPTLSLVNSDAMVIERIMNSFAFRNELNSQPSMAEIIEGKGRFIPDLKAGLDNLLAEPWWGIPAHYGPAQPKEKDQTVDLFNAETAGLVTWIRYMLNDALGHDMQQKLDQEIRRRLLQPALKTNYWWKHSRMNWTPWICSNWLTAVLICENDGPGKVS